MPWFGSSLVVLVRGHVDRRTANQAPDQPLTRHFVSGYSPQPRHSSAGRAHRRRSPPPPRRTPGAGVPRRLIRRRHERASLPLPAERWCAALMCPTGRSARSDRAASNSRSGGSGGQGVREPRRRHGASTNPAEVRPGLEARPCRSTFQAAATLGRARKSRAAGSQRGSRPGPRALVTRVFVPGEAAEESRRWERRREVRWEPRGARCGHGHLPWHRRRPTPAAQRPSGLGASVPRRRTRRRPVAPWPRTTPGSESRDRRRRL
jgi:hypothetical protein